MSIYYFVKEKSMKQKFFKVHKKGLYYIPKGQQPSGFISGDFILTHGEGFICELIRFGQRLRFTGDNARFAYWNHAALLVNPEGDLIEALGDGIKKTHISKYTQKEYVVVSIEASDADRAEMLQFAESFLTMEYGYATFISIGLSLLTGLRFSFGFEGQFICSGLVARALERTQEIFQENPTSIMPATLAKYYGVEIPV
jgi:hypothetical protein